MTSNLLVKLNQVEEAQLGSVRLKQNGNPSTVQWPSKDQWPSMRAMLVANSVKANSNLDSTFTAYTPGETLALMNLAPVKAWHQRAIKYQVPRNKTIVLVPCAKTKPWDEDSSGKSSYYSSYHKLVRDFPDLYFVTVSEPLGLVSMEDWSDFLQYDNPGLFHDPAQRSSLLRSDWLKAGYSSALATPFDEIAYKECITKLGALIASFLSNHHSHKIISLVDGSNGKITTHGAMLDKALSFSSAKVLRFPKRGEARISPYPYLHQVISSSMTSTSY